LYCGAKVKRNIAEKEYEITVRKEVITKVLIMAKSKKTARQRAIQGHGFMLPLEPAVRNLYPKSWKVEKVKS